MVIRRNVDDPSAGMAYLDDCEIAAATGDVCFGSHQNRNNGSSITTATNSTSMVLSVNATRAIPPPRLRLTATIDTMNAVGALKSIRLGPSQLSGWPQQNATARPTPTNGTMDSSKAALANISLDSNRLDGMDARSIPSVLPTIKPSGG